MDTPPVGAEAQAKADADLVEALEAVIRGEPPSPPREIHLDYSPHRSDNEGSSDQSWTDPTISAPSRTRFNRTIPCTRHPARAATSRPPRGRQPPQPPGRQPPPDGPGYVPVHLSSPERRCWRCGGRGHRREGCSNLTVLFCSRCGRLGSLSRNCPCRRPPEKTVIRCPRCGLRC